MTQRPPHAGARAGGTYLFVLPWSLHHTGGVNQVVINLYRTCEQGSEFDPLVLTADWDQRTAKENVQEGCNCLSMRLRIPWGRPRDWLAFALYGPMMLLRLRAMLRRYDVRVVNIHYPSLAAINFALLKVLRLFTGSLVISVHGLDIRSASRSAQPIRAAWRWLFHRADAVVCVSQAMGQDVEALDRRAPLPCVVIRNGVDEAEIRREASRSGPPPQPGSRPYILNVGTFEHKKGHDVLIEAFAMVAKAFPDVDLVIIGRDGDRRAAVQELIRARQLEHRVTCRVDLAHAEAIAVMRDATIFVLPSRAEGLPLVLLEAGILGVPIVATRVGGNAEVVRDETSGLLVDAEDALALGRSIGRLLGEPALGQRLAAQLTADIRSDFTWAGAWQAYSNLAERLA